MDKYRKKDVVSDLELDQFKNIEIDKIKTSINSVSINKNKWRSIFPNKLPVILLSVLIIMITVVIVNNPQEIPNGETMQDSTETEDPLNLENDNQQDTEIQDVIDHNLEDEEEDVTLNSFSNSDFESLTVDLFPTFNDMKTSEAVQFHLVEFMCYEVGTIFANYYYFMDMVSGDVIKATTEEGAFTFYGGQKYVIALIEIEWLDRYSFVTYDENSVFSLRLADEKVLFPQRYLGERSELDNSISGFFDEVGIIYNEDISTLARGEGNGGICNDPAITDDYPTISDLMNVEHAELLHLRLISMEDDSFLSQLEFLNLVSLETININFWSIIDDYVFNVDTEYIMLLTKIPNDDGYSYYIRDTSSIIEIQNDVIIFPDKYLAEREGLDNSIDSVLEELGLVRD